MDRKAKLLMEKMEVQAKFPYLIEITYRHQDDTTEVLRYANTDEDINFTEIINGVAVTHTFTAGFFKLNLPERTSSGMADAIIYISAIDQTWIEKIRSSDKRSTIRFVGAIDYYDGQRKVEPIEDMEFTLTNADANELTIQWSMKFDVLADVKVPYDVCDDRVCPALV